MKLKDRFSSIKNRYLNDIVLIKSGSFYITFDQDAIIMNYLFSYQITSGKIGFPLKNIEKVKNELKTKKIHYIVLDDEKQERYEEEINHYVEYLNYAKKKEYENAMNQMLLDRIHFLLEQNSDNYGKIKKFIDEL